MITGDSERIVGFDGAGTRRLAFSDSGGIVAFARDGTAVAYRDACGTLGAGLKAMSLKTGERVPAEVPDDPVFDQDIFDLEGQQRGWRLPPYAAPRYRAEDVPTGIALVDLAMAGLSDDRRAGVAHDRIVVE